MIYGNNVDNWVGTKSLSEGIVIIKDETQKIYSSYNSIFYQGKTDWSWI